jgi:hypothetical protein
MRYARRLWRAFCFAGSIPAHGHWDFTARPFCVAAARSTSFTLMLAAGVAVLAAPCRWRDDRGQSWFDLITAENLIGCDAAMKEWAGPPADRQSGKSGAFLPGPAA